MIEILSMTLAANTPQSFFINGEYVEVLDAQYPLDVQMSDRNGGPLSIMRNAEASFFSRPGKFGTVTLTSANAQSVRIFVGSGDAGTRRISSTVAVVDGNKARSAAGGSFAWRCINYNASGTTRAAVQLWNPVGSGVRVVLDSVLLGINVAAEIAWGTTNVMLPTVASALPGNMLASGAAGVALAKQDSTTGFVVGTALGSDGLVANGSVQINLPRPIVLPPGYGFWAQPTIVNVGVFGSMLYFEESLT